MRFEQEYRDDGWVRGHRAFGLLGGRKFAGPSDDGAGHGGRGRQGHLGSDDLSGGGFGGRRGGGHPGGGRRGKRFAGDELRLMVLSLIEQEPRHGYQIIRAFAERSAEAYSPSPGVLYPLLTLLQDMELIAEAASEGRTRSFSLTEAGKAELTAGRETADAAFARLESMATEARRSDVGPVRRAMGNLRTVAVERLERSEDSAELAFSIAALLDEVAQKIERL